MDEWLTMSQVAKLLGYTERGWRHWENGTRSMRSVLLAQYKTLANPAPETIPA
ncbi:MAG: XRE family transcriptional regulator [Desulfurellales bacterium]|nr:MAG: XRE family transcriptional regulator [Desulfurellales bacterium]